MLKREVISARECDQLRASALAAKIIDHLSQIKRAAVANGKMREAAWEHITLNTYEDGTGYLLLGGKMFGGPIWQALDDAWVWASRSQDDDLAEIHATLGLTPDGRYANDTAPSAPSAG